MAIDKRINYRFGGDTMGGPNDRSSRGPGGPPGGGATSMGSNRDFSPGPSSSGSNRDNRPTMADIAGPVTAPTTSLPSNIGFNESFSVSTDPMDFKEQYRVGNVPTNPPGVSPFVTFDNPYMSKGLETNRYNNYIDALNLSGETYKPFNIPAYVPGSTLINTAGNFLGNLGFKTNTNFFAENVAGKYGYGYGLEDYKQYMADRMSGKVSAYGNPALGQNAINERASTRDNQGIMQLKEINPILLEENEETPMTDYERYLSYLKNFFGGI